MFRRVFFSLFCKLPSFGDCHTILSTVYSWFLTTLPRKRSQKVELKTTAWYHAASRIATNSGVPAPIIAGNKVPLIDRASWPQRTSICRKGDP